jgi:hypothetical protein
MAFGIVPTAGVRKASLLDVEKDPLVKRVNAAIAVNFVYGCLRLLLTHSPGKYYHRYRKPREVVYNTDPDHHIQLRDGTSRKRAKPTLDVAPTPLEELSPAPPDSPTLAKEELPDDNDQASSRGSSSEPLIKQSVKRAAGEDRIKAKEEALPDMLPKSPAIQNAKPSGTAESASPSDATTSKKEASAEAGHSDGQARPMPVTLTTDPADVCILSCQSVDSNADYPDM